MEVQVNKDHYKFNSYITLQRRSSFWYQVYETLKLGPGSVLEIGPGVDMYGHVLRKEGVDYFSCDFDPELSTDFVGDIKSLDLQQKFDVVCAFQVLEHLPFEDFSVCLNNLAKHSKRYVLLTLPIFGLGFSFSFKFPFLKNKTVSFTLPFPKKHKFNGQHYWEIGVKGSSLYKVKAEITKFFEIMNDYTLPENNYHHLFVLKKQG